MDRSQAFHNYDLILLNLSTPLNTTTSNHNHKNGSFSMKRNRGGVIQLCPKGLFERVWLQPLRDCGEVCIA